MRWLDGIEMIGWYHRLNGHEFEQTLGDSERQGSLTCCSPWGRIVGHNLATEQQQKLHGSKRTTMSSRSRKENILCRGA